MLNDIEQKVLEYIEKQKLFQSGSRVLLSLSAGKDSMALLHVLYHIREYLALQLELFHLNHCARGEESDGDEQFVRETAQRFDIPITIKRMDVRKSRPGGHSFEEHARTIRYELLSECARERHCDVIATAHTRDDSIETIIMRLFQGTGIHGLRGIEPRRDTIVRPLLCLSSEEVLSFLRERNVSWREDATNSDTGFLRNYVRHVLIPIIKKRFPDYASALMRLANISRDEHALLDELAQKLYGTDAYQRLVDSIIISHETIRGNEALIKHLIARAFHELGGYTSSGMLDDIMKKMRSGRAHQELFRGRGLCAMKTNIGGASRIRIFRAAVAKPLKDWEYTIPLSDIPQTIAPEEAQLTLALFWADEEFFSNHKTTEGFAFIAIPEGGETTFLLRNRRKGDRILLNGNMKKIKELFIDRKLSPDEKNIVPIILINGRIAAVCTGCIGKGYNRIADDFLVTPGAKKILAIRRG